MIKLRIIGAVKHIGQLPGNKSISVFINPGQAEFYITEPGDDPTQLPEGAILITRGDPGKFFNFIENAILRAAHSID